MGVVCRWVWGYGASGGKVSVVLGVINFDQVTMSSTPFSKEGGGEGEG